MKEFTVTVRIVGLRDFHKIKMALVPWVSYSSWNESRSYLTARVTDDLDGIEFLDGVKRTVGRVYETVPFEVEVRWFSKESRTVS